MSDMEPEALALIEAARSEAGLSPEQHAAGRTRLAKQLGVVAVGAALETVTVGSTAAAAGAAKTTVAVGTATLLSKVALGLSVVGVSVAVYAVTREPRRAPTPPNEQTVATNPAPALPMPPALTEPTYLVEPQVEAPAVAPRAVAASGPSPSATNSKSADTFAGDAKLLRDVHEAIGTGRAEQALAMLDARRAQPTEGAFAQERAAARVVVLCRLGRTADARAEAARFLTAYPKSPLGERVRHTCDEPARK